MERRKQLHERIGQALEILYAGSLDDHLADLAHHYCHSDNVQKAIDYLHRAGILANRRSAYNEALKHLTNARELLSNIVGDSERLRRELGIL